MFGQFLHIVVSSLKLDRNIFRDPKYFGEAAIYFAGLIMILDGVAGAVAANTFVKTSLGISGITALITWLIWSIFIYVIGVKLFPDGNLKIPFPSLECFPTLRESLRPGKGTLCFWARAVFESGETLPGGKWNFRISLKRSILGKLHSI